MALPPSAKPDPFQNMLLKSIILQKHRSLLLSIAGHSSAPSFSHESLCTCLSPFSSVSFSTLEPFFLQPSTHQYVSVLGQVPHSATSSAALFCVGEGLRMFADHMVFGDPPNLRTLGLLWPTGLARGRAKSLQILCFLPHCILKAQLRNSCRLFLYTVCQHLPFWSALYCLWPSFACHF